MYEFEHGGNLKKLSIKSGHNENEILDYSASINPLGPPEWINSVIEENIHELLKYPDPDCINLINSIALKYDVNKNTVAVGNGVTEIIHAIPSVLLPDKAFIPIPTYSDYYKPFIRFRIPVEFIYMDESRDFSLPEKEMDRVVCKNSVVYICNPNNPTGTLYAGELIRELASRHKDTYFVVDESFMEFTGSENSLIQRRPSNVIVIMSITKFYAIPGLRLGFAICEEKISKKIKEYLPPWSVNTLAQIVGTKAIQDEKYIQKTVHDVKKCRDTLSKKLNNIPSVKIFPGAANYLLLKIKNNLDANEVAEKMLQKKVAVRVCDNFKGFDDKYIRVAVKKEEDNNKLIDTFKACLEVV